MDNKSLWLIAFHFDLSVNEVFEVDFSRTPIVVETACHWSKVELLNTAYKAGVMTPELSLIVNVLASPLFWKCLYYIFAPFKV